MVCHFQLHGDHKTSKILAFNCDICSCPTPDKGDITSNTYCLQQFLQILPFVEGIFPCRFISNDQRIYLPRTSMEILREYVLTIVKFEKSTHEITQHDPEIKQKLITSPYTAYRILETTFKTAKNRFIREFIGALERTKLISQAKKQLGNDITTNQQDFLNNLLKIQKTKIGYSNYLLSEVSQTLDGYDVGPFRIRVFETPQVPLEKFYQVVVSLEEVLSPSLLQKLYPQQQTLSIEEIGLQTLETLTSQKISDFKQYLSTHFKELTNIEQHNLAIFATAQLLNLTKTMPLLLDDDVQEIYLDKPGSAYYLDHARWGRCKSNLAPLDSELSHIVTRLRLESRKPLDEKNPSLKTELKTKLFHVRAAIDIPPLAYEGLHLNIRKIRLRTLTLPELIINGTISLSAAAFLILCMNLRINITISGEPATGKTTLANAINLLAPPNWRKIAIEDALESITFDEGDRHKVTFRVDPFDSFEKTQSTKSNEIIRLLHRSPDWVFLGEIQTAEHSAAMFHAISAGIRGIQTCHANSNNELLLRWQVHHNIPEVCFQSLGLLVHMNKEVIQGQIIRKVTQISEVLFDSDKAILNPIFEWNNSSSQLELKTSNLFSSIISQSCKFQQLTEPTIRKRLDSYQETLAALVSNQEYDPNVVVKAFDKIYSNESSVRPKEVKTKTKSKGEEESSIISLH